MSDETPLATATAARTLVMLAALVVIVWGLKQGGALLLPFLFAVFLSILAAPLVLWLERLRVQPALAVLVTMLGVLGVLAGFGALLTTSLTGFDEALPGYREALDALFARLTAHLGSYGVDLSELLHEEHVEPGMVVGMAGSFVGSVIAALSNTALVVLTMVFILLEVAGLPGKLRAAMGDPQADLAEFSAIMREVQRYLLIKTAVSAVTGLCATLLLMVLGVDFPVLWGLVAFLLNSLVVIIGILGGYAFSVFIQDVNPGAFAAGITLLTGVPEVIISCVKAALFGLIAGLVACYRGLMITGGGAKAVGNAVNETVVYAFMALFVVNVVVTAIGIRMTTG